VIVDLVVAVWLFRGWQWIAESHAVRTVPVSACGCGCGGGKVTIVNDLAVDVAGRQWGCFRWRLRDWQWLCGCVEGGSG
jgi:hypothetical protein